MKALVKKEPKEGLTLESVLEPQTGPSDVLIKISRTGICGTDLHIYKWDDWASKTVPTPMVVGHEFVGEIVEVGENVRDFHVGEIVSGEGHVVCGHCRNCMAGRRHLCNDTAGIGVTRPGAFAEYISLPQTNAWVHKPDIDLDVASIFDPFGNATHSALSFPVLGEDVLVTGAGPIGIMSAAIAQHAEEGGVAGRGARYAENHRILVEGMRELGFETLLPDVLQAPIIVTFHTPADPNFQFAAFYDHLRARGYVIYPGKLTQTDSFRIGCIGQVGSEQMHGLIAAVTSSLEDMDVTRCGP